MAVRSIQDHVQALIGRKVAEAKVDGANSPDVEARAILESIALNLLLKPRAVLYLSHLARNSLKNTVDQEIEAVDTLMATVNDLANVTFIPADSSHLEKAKTSLLQMEGLDKVDAQGGDFQRFSRSIDDFLNKSLAKSVRKLGETELSRPQSEAAVDLPVDFAALVELHAEMNKKLLSLSTGVDNFTASPLGTILGLSTAYRARVDIEEIIESIDNGDSGSQLRDIAIRLIGDRAAIKSIGSLPSINALLLDTANDLPSGYEIQAESDLATASALSSIGPWFFSFSSSASVTVNGTTQSVTHFPQAVSHLDNRACVVSSPGISFPAMIPAGYYLFVHVRRATAAGGYTLQTDGTYLKQIRVSITSGVRTLAQILTDLNTALGSDAEALEYVTTGTNRIVIIGNSSILTVSISPIHTEPSSSTVGDINLYTTSIHSFLGFRVGQRGDYGSTPVSYVVDALNTLFGTLIEASQTQELKVQIETVPDDIGTSLTLTLPSAMSMNGTFLAQSESLRLFGVVYGEIVDPVDPTPLLDVGDFVVTPSGTRTVAGLTTERIILSSAVNTFTGDITAESALALAVEALDEAVDAFLGSWTETRFYPELTDLDRAIAILSGKVTPATRNAVTSLLSSLKSELQTLSSVLETGPVPSNIGTEERGMINGIVATLTERRYDRALSLLLGLDIQTFFEMTGDTASFGTNLLKSMSTLAQTDIQFPNTENDEDSGFKGLIEEPEA